MSREMNCQYCGVKTDKSICGTCLVKRKIIRSHFIRVAEARAKKNDGRWHEMEAILNV